MKKISLGVDVLTQARKRISYLFDEFEVVVCGYSGGKDSTIIFNLALEEAKKRGVLLPVVFLDQEAEWNQTIDQVDLVMRMEGVQPFWYQMPIQLFNSSSFEAEWLWCWAEGEEWIRQKSNISIKENKFGTTRFAELFTKIAQVEWEGKKMCYVSGVRAEESPGRKMGMTGSLTYKAITWGKKLGPDAKGVDKFTFYPIYDWSVTDVWHAINKFNWPYNKLYDVYFQHGVPTRDMRVSNLHHETAVKSLYILQELDGDLYNKLTKRLKGIDTFGKLQKVASSIPPQLPFMFKDWKEYRDYLLKNLVTNAEFNRKLTMGFASFDRWIEKYKEYLTADDLKKIYRACINSILVNDWELVKLDNTRTGLLNEIKFKYGLKKAQIKV